LSRGNRLEEEVWNTFTDQREELERIAQAIRGGYATVEGTPTSLDAIEEEETFPEGRVLFRLHASRERNRDLVKKAKQRAKTRHGKLECAACKFDFARVYGALGEDFIECHHTLALSHLKAERPTRLDEVALVCSNCHRMIHRRRPWLGMDELSRIVGEQLAPES
jgi:5-methylcytosine-specific restriction protein A